jgi:hypothetical protein
MGFLQVVMQKVAFIIWGTYLSGNSYLVKMAWCGGGFALLFFSFGDEGILWARWNIDSWSR